LGLETSDNIGGIMKNRIDETKDGISGMYDRSRLKQEQLVKDIVSENYSFWMENGILKEQMELVEDIVPLMTTKHKVTTEKLVEGIKGTSEVIED
jgi:hypothetical protein